MESKASRLTAHLPEGILLQILGLPPHALIQTTQVCSTTGIYPLLCPLPLNTPVPTHSSWYLCPSPHLWSPHLCPRPLTALVLSHPSPYLCLPIPHDTCALPPLTCTRPSLTALPGGMLLTHASPHEAPKSRDMGRLSRRSWCSWRMGWEGA